MRGGTQTATGRRGILPIERVELGQQLWRLEYREHDVFLLVNKAVPGLGERAHSDPLFYAVVYPQVVRDVLQVAIFDEAADIDENSERWPNLWLRFGQSLHPLRSRPPAYTEEEDAREWIDTVVESFSASHSLKDRFAAAAAAQNGGNL